MIDLEDQVSSYPHDEDLMPNWYLPSLCPYCDEPAVEILACPNCLDEGCSRRECLFGADNELCVACQEESPCDVPDD